MCDIGSRIVKGDKIYFVRDDEIEGYYAQHPELIECWHDFGGHSGIRVLHPEAIGGCAEENHPFPIEMAEAYNRGDCRKLLDKAFGVKKITLNTNGQRDGEYIYTDGGGGTIRSWYKDGRRQGPVKHVNRDGVATRVGDAHENWIKWNGLPPCLNLKMKKTTANAGGRTFRKSRLYKYLNPIGWWEVTGPRGGQYDINVNLETITLIGYSSRRFPRGLLDFVKKSLALEVGDIVIAKGGTTNRHMQLMWYGETFPAEIKQT